MKQPYISLTLLGLVSVSLFAASCDPQARLMSMMRDQGLTLLRPARDYVQVAGLVVVPKQGAPEYVDPLDPVPSGNGTVVDIKAIIASQSQQNTTGVGTALTGLAQLVSLPVGLKFSRTSTVTLGQIDMRGKRLISNGVAAIAAGKMTSAEAKNDINAGGRVFVVQEVYTATKLNLVNSSNTALDLTLASGKALPECGPGAADKSSDQGKNATTPKPAGEAKSDEGRAAAGAKTAPAPPAAGSSNDAKSNNKSKDSESPAAKSNADDSKGVAVQLCRLSQNTVAFTSAAPIPFAVRLAELQLNNGGISVKRGAFKLPQSLGSTEVEQTTATLPNDTIGRLRHRRVQTSGR